MATNGHRSRRLPTSGVYVPGSAGAGSGKEEGDAPTFTTVTTKPATQASANSGSGQMHYGCSQATSNSAAATGVTNAGYTGESGLRHYSVIAQDADVALAPKIPSLSTSRFTPLPSTTTTKDRYDEYLPPKPQPISSLTPLASLLPPSTSTNIEQTGLVGATASSTPPPDIEEQTSNGGGGAGMAVSEQFYVDQFHVGSVIGKNGATINKIKEKTGTFLSFIGDKKAEGGKVPLLIRAPTTEQLEQAKAQVNEIIDQRLVLASRYGGIPMSSQQLPVSRPVEERVPHAPVAVAETNRSSSRTPTWQMDYAQKVVSSASPSSEIRPTNRRELERGADSRVSIGDRQRREEMDMVVEVVNVPRAAVDEAALDQIRDEFGVKLKRTIGNGTHEKLYVNGPSDAVELARCALKRLVVVEEQEHPSPPPVLNSQSAELPARAGSIESGLKEQQPRIGEDLHASCIPTAMFKNAMKGMEALCEKYERENAELRAANRALRQELDSQQVERR